MHIIKMPGDAGHFSLLACLQQAGKFFPEFRQFRLDDVHTILLLRILTIKIAVKILSRIKNR